MAIERDDLAFDGKGSPSPCQSVLDIQRLGHPFLSAQKSIGINPSSLNKQIQQFHHAPLAASSGSNLMARSTFQCSGHFYFRFSK